MWKEYFGPKANIFGVDIDPNCKNLEEEQIEIFIGDQEDRAFLRSLTKSIPRIDILIDDGGHTMRQQINTLEELFPHIDANGVYLCEDLHTSYWSEYGGGYGKRGTFIEYSKNFVDNVNAWHSKTRKLQVTRFTKTVHSLHYYDSMLVIEKRPIGEPAIVQSGNIQKGDTESPYLSNKLSDRIRRRVKREIDKRRKHAI